MNDALIALAWTAALAGVLWLPYVLARMQVWGLKKTLDNPDPNAPALPDWATRAQRAHANLTENLVHFAALVLIAQILGIAVLRTLAFVVGWVAEILIFLKVIEALYAG